MFDFEYKLDKDGLDFTDVSISELTSIVLLRFPVMPPEQALGYRDKDPNFSLLICLLISELSGNGNGRNNPQYMPVVADVEAEQIDTIDTATYRLQFQVLIAIYFFQCQCKPEGQFHLEKATGIIIKYHKL